MTDPTQRRTHTVDHIPRDADQYVFLANEVVDSLVSSVLELSAELWSLRRRTLILERVVETHVPAALHQVEAYMPTAQDEADWHGLREAFVKRVLGPFARTLPLERPAVPAHEFMD